MENDVNTLKQR